MSIQFDTRSNRTSLLDDKLDVSYIDVIRNLVIKYLKSNTYETNIILRDGFYCFTSERLPYKMEYDDNPGNWYIVFKLFSTPSIFYITKYPSEMVRFKHNLGFVRLKPGLIPITLETILKQSTKDLSNPL